MKNMERRRKFSRHFLQTMQTPTVLLILHLSIILVLCSVAHYADCIMTFPDESGVYSLFPDEDLKTGRKRFRFDEETTRSYRDGRDFSSSIVRSYPMLPHDRFHRPVDYSGSRQVFDRYRDRQSRVYFDDNFRSSRFDLPRITPRPRPIERPGPIIFETSRPLHHHFLPERFPPPAIGQSKLPVGASNRASGEDVPTRIHIFNPESNSFGNPRNAGGDTSSERTQGPPSNFVETGPPGPESFLNHEEFLEYQKKIAFARFHEQPPNTGNGGSAGSNGKKVLFESKEPFEIDGLVPPDKSGEISGKLQPSSQVPVQQTHGQLEQQHHQQQQDQHNVHDQRQHQRQGEGQKVRPSAVDNHHHNPVVSAVEEDKDTGGGEVDSGINEKGDEEESENGKSEVTQLPPTHNTKSGRAHSIINSGSSGSASTRNSKFTPSISHDEQVGGTRFRLPTTAVSYSSDDEPPNLNGFVPVVPFHLIAAEQPRTINLERQRQQQQQRIIPHTPEYSSTTTTTSTTTARSVVPVTITTAASTTTSRSKGEKSGLRGTEVSKSFSTSSSSSSSSSAGTHENIGSSGKGFSSPASPILHATAGERSNSETLSKVAITKQQELKRLQKQRQLMHQLTTHSHPGLFPDIGLSDSSSSSDSADNSDKTPGTYTNTNDYFDDTDTQTLLPPDPIIPPTEDTSSSFPSTSFDLPDQESDTKSIEDDTNNIHSHTHITSNTNHTSFESKQPYHHHTELTKHNSVTQGDETIKSTSVVVDTNNEIFDTRAVIKTANGIRQGEFHLEGYMVKNGDGLSSGSRSSVADRADDYGNKYEETVGNLLNHRQLYDYSDNNMPRVGITSPMIIIPDTPSSPAIPSQLPGTTTPDLQQTNEQEALTPSLMNTTPSPSSTMSSSTTSQQDVNDDDGDVTGSEYFSRSNEPTVVVHNKSGPVVGNPVDAFDSEPTSPESRRTRLSENDENSFTIIPPNPYYVNYRKNNFGSSYTDYYANSDNKINSRNLSTSSKSRSSNEDSRSGGSLSSEYVDENGAFDHHDDDFYRLGKAFRYGSYVNGKRKQARKARKRNRLEIIDANSDLPSSISIPVQATLTTGLENLHGESINSIDVSNSLSSNGADYDPNAPLYLESSETLINKTYYLDGNYEGNNNNSVKSSNFIKVTRIKVPSGSASKETAEKTSSTILARRTPKQAVIISETAAGVRPRVVGSVVEAGPAWPGLVSNFNFLRPNNRTFTATATVRPRGNSGTNPTHPTSVIAHHVQHQMKQQESPKPTHFQLQQIRQHPSVTAKSIDESNHHHHQPQQQHNRPASNDNKSHNASNTGITINKNGNGVVKIINKINSTTAVPEAHVANRRLYSSEENVSSTQIKSNSSTGVVSMVHAHISHCPKLHSPTEVICDVHIREGHGIPNPQLTVGWRRKFYNSTQPDILLALNKTPASGENGRFDPHHSIVELEEGKANERLEEFHDKFNVTLAPGISPMLRSVLLIRSVTAPDCGTYQCEVTDGINVLKSETLLFLCH